MLSLSVPAVYRMKSPAEVAIWREPVVGFMSRGGSEFVTTYSHLWRDIQVIILIKSYQVTLPLNELIEQNVLRFKIEKVLHPSNFLNPQVFKIIFFHFVSTEKAGQGIFWQIFFRKYPISF